jgi:hypothetical protein
MGHNVIGIRSMRLCRQSGTANTLTKLRWFRFRRAAAIGMTARTRCVLRRAAKVVSG